MSSVCEDRLKQTHVVLRRSHSLDAVANHRLSKAILSWWMTYWPSFTSDLVTRWPSCDLMYVKWSAECHINVCLSPCCWSHVPLIHWGNSLSSAGRHSLNILGRFLISGKLQENIWQSSNLSLGNNNVIIIVINSFIFCVMLDVITWRC